MQSEIFMQGAAPLPPVDRRHFGLGLLALLLVPALAACKDAQPGSGLQTIRRQKELQPGGR
jgi:hypothetical protein